MPSELRRCLFAVVAATISISAATATGNAYEERLGIDASRLRDALVKQCPDRADEIARLGKPMPDAERAAALSKLAVCGKSEPLFHQTLGSAYLAAGDFKASEARSVSYTHLRAHETPEHL